MNENLSPSERQLLLSIARQALEAALTGGSLPDLPLDSFSSRLKELGASFVTLTRCGELRGCIGALEPRDPLALDVREHAIAAATQDYRFPPVSPQELPEIEIEISVLTVPKDLEYSTPDDLLARLRPGVDGVTLLDGWRRATFLPQVWEKLPNPQVFLSYLCQKMGAPSDLWCTKKLRVQTYQVEEFHEEKIKSVKNSPH